MGGILYFEYRPIVRDILDHICLLKADTMQLNTSHKIKKMTRLKIKTTQNKIKFSKMSQILFVVC